MTTATPISHSHSPSPSSPSINTQTTTRTLAILIGPASSPDALLSITTRLTSAGFQVLSERRERWYLPHDADFLAEFLRAEGVQAPGEGHEQGLKRKKRWMLRLSSAEIYVMVLERRRAVELLNDILGPDDEKDGLGSVQGSLRATYGVGNLYASMSSEAADRQLAIAFPEWASDEALDRLNDEELLGDTSGVALEAAEIAAAAAAAAAQSVSEEDNRRAINSSNEENPLSSRHSRMESRTTDVSEATATSTSSMLPEDLDNAPQIDDEDDEEHGKAWSAAAFHQATRAEGAAAAAVTSSSLNNNDDTAGDVSQDGTTILHGAPSSNYADDSFGYQGSEPSFSNEEDPATLLFPSSSIRTPRASQAIWESASKGNAVNAPSSPSIAPSGSVSVTSAPAVASRSPSKRTSVSASATSTTNTSTTPRQVIQPSSIRPPTVQPRLSRAAALRMGLEVPSSDASKSRRKAEAAASASSAVAASSSTETSTTSALRKSTIVVPKSLSKPAIVPRLNKAAAARTGVSVTPSPLLHKRSTSLSVSQNGGEGGGGTSGATASPSPLNSSTNVNASHKRPTSSLGISGLVKKPIDVPKSLAKPSIAPRLNRAAVARLGGGGGNGGEGSLEGTLTPKGGPSASTGEKGTSVEEPSPSLSRLPNPNPTPISGVSTTSTSSASPHKRSTSSLGLSQSQSQRQSQSQSQTVHGLRRRPSVSIASLAQPSIQPRSNAADRARRMSLGSASVGPVTLPPTTTTTTGGGGRPPSRGPGAAMTRIRPGSALGTISTSTPTSTSTREGSRPPSRSSLITQPTSSKMAVGRREREGGTNRAPPPSSYRAVVG